MSDVHADMQALVEARAGLPAATTIAEERANWTEYSRRLSQAPPSDMLLSLIHI